MNISNVGKNLIKSFEGCRLTAYKPVATEKYYTIGWGHYGADVYAGMTITQAKADAMFDTDVVKYVNAVRNTALGFSPNQNQFDALCSFCYNLGTGIMSNFKGLSASQVASKMPLYVYGGGVVLPGLVRRRKLEVELFNSGSTSGTVDDNFNAISLEQCSIVDSNNNVIGTIFKHERVEIRWITSDYRKYVKFMTSNGFKEGLVENGKSGSVVSFDDAYTHFNNSGKTVNVVDGNGNVTGAIYANEKVMRAWVDTDGNAYIVYDNAAGEKLIKAGNVPAGVLEDISKMPKPDPDVHQDITYNAIATEQCNVEDSAGKVIGCVYKHERFQIKWIDSSNYRKWVKYNAAGGGYKEGYIEADKTWSAIFIKDAYTHFNNSGKTVNVVDGNGNVTGAIYANEKVMKAWIDTDGNAYIVYDNAAGERLIKTGNVPAGVLEVIAPPDPDVHEDITYDAIATEECNVEDSTGKVIGCVYKHERFQIKWIDSNDYRKWVKYNAAAGGYKEGYIEKAKTGSAIFIKDAYTHYNNEASNVDVKDSNGNVVGCIYPNEKVMRAWIETDGNAYILFDNAAGERLIKSGYVSASILNEIK